MSLPVIILGAGGHAKVLIEALKASSAQIIGVVDTNLALAGTIVHGVPVLGDDKEVFKYSCNALHLVNGVGSVGAPHRRKRLFEEFKAKGYFFATVVHTSAIIASQVKIGEGSQIMAGAVIQPGCIIGLNAIVNTNASIDHDCQIDDHAHVAPGATLSGNVLVGRSSHVGVGATISQGVNIGKDSIVGAGSVVLKNVPAGEKVYGVPAKVAKK
jgi:UDP-perosamine 4-acetyltransferase